MYLEILTCHDHGRIRIQPVCESVNNMNRDSLGWILRMKNLCGNESDLGKKLENSSPTFSKSSSLAKRSGYYFLQESIKLPRTLWFNIWETHAIILNNRLEF